MAQNTDTIQTERLFLRGISECDTEQIVKWRSDPAVFQYFKSPHQITPGEHLNWYHNNYLSDPNRFDWMCFKRETQTAIGVVGLTVNAEQVEVNYLLAPEAQHKGYAAEAVQGMIRYILKKWDCKEIVAEIHMNNEPSIRMIKKLGFALASRKGPFGIYTTEV